MLKAMSAEQGWGRAFLLDCNIDPDDEADVRAAYEACRRSHGRWLVSGEGEMNADVYYMLVDAVKNIYGWECFPFDWPAPTLVLLRRPLRNLMPRRSVFAEGAEALQATPFKRASTRPGIDV